MLRISGDAASLKVCNDGFVAKTVTSRSNFYREELAKHWQCFEQQREHYSDKVITDVETALGKLMLRVDLLCAEEHGAQLVSRLLRTIDGVTRLSAWSKQNPVH